MAIPASNESQTGNPIRYHHYAENSSNGYIEAVVTASYVRDGDKVTITINITDVDWFGKYAQLYIDDEQVIENGYEGYDTSKTHENITPTKTYTYTQTKSKTYTFTLRTYIQYQTTWQGYTFYDYLTITVPAATSKLWCVGTDGKWHAAKIYYSTGSAWKNAELYDTNHILT